MQNIRIKLGKRVRELRKQLGWSQEELGERANLHPTYVGGIERGERNLSLENLHRIASAFSLSLAELFDFPTPKKSERSLLELRILALIRNQDANVLDLIWNVVDQVDQWTKKALPSAVD